MRPQLLTLPLTLLILALWGAPAFADARYTVHPTNGEFAKTAHPCGAQTRDELFDRMIAKTPTLVVDPKRTMILEVAGKPYPADDVLGEIGWWYYKSTNSSKTLVISIKPSSPKFKVIELHVIRRLDEIECTERWVGLVDVPQ